MLNKFLQFINKIINIGVSEETDSTLRNRIQIANAYVIIGVSLIVLNMAKNAIDGDLFGIKIGLIWLSISVFISIFSYKKKHYLSFIYIIVVFTLMTNAVHILLGRSAFISSLYIVSMLMSIFFFDKKIERWGYVFFVMLNYVATHTYLTFYDSVMKEPLGVDIHIYFVFSSIAILGITSKVLNQNKQQLEETQRLLQQVENKQQELERFAYITSHDLKEPLRSISGFSELLQRRLKKDKDETTIEYLNFIKSNVEQLSELMDAMLNYIEISNAKSIQKTEVDLNKVMAKIKVNLNDVFDEETYEIYYSEFPKIKGVEKQMTILFQHLIENGIKFNKNSLAIIQLDWRGENEDYIFSIRDNGIGIDKAYYEKIFLPFKKLHNKSDYSGSGIGLPICKRIIEEHQGQIWLHSEVMQGTTFYFSVPKP